MIWQPWEHSTGKARASQNAYKGAVRPFLRELARVLREQESQLGDL